MNKLIVAGVLTLMSTSAMAETVTDHFKSVIEQHLTELKFVKMLLSKERLIKVVLSLVD